LLIDEQYRFLDTRAKACFDALRITASTLFGLLLDDFRPHYRNHRHDHVMLRNLTRTSGFLHRQDHTLVAQLWLKGTHQPWQRRAIQRFLNTIAERLTTSSTTSLRYHITILDQSPSL